MNCPNCQQEARKFGKNRNGSQRFVCRKCHQTFTDPNSEATDGRRVDRERMILCLRMLLEGNSIRATMRLTGVDKRTIILAMVEAGQNCERFMESTHRHLPVNDVQADEIWGFVGAKQRTCDRKGYVGDIGDAWAFTAIERESKFIITWHIGKRTPRDTLAFADKLHNATAGRFQLSTDGYRPYRIAIPHVFGESIDYAQIAKVYGKPEGEGPEQRYSPPQVVDIRIVPLIGNPDDEKICTSHAERANRTFRMQIRRMTRLTDAHSKKWANHEAAFALFIGYYNYCRPHMTLTERNGRKTSPAMEAGITDHVWTVAELLDVAARQ